MTAPKDYPIKLSKEQEEAISTMPPMEIPQYLHEIEVAAGLRNRDPWNSEVMHVVEPDETAAQPLSQTFTINGETHTFTGANQAELDRAQVEFFRTLTENSSARLETTNDTLARNPNGTFAKQRTDDSAVASADKAILELKYKRGEIDTASYMRESGALDDYLQEMGIDVQGYKQNKHEVQNWANATKEFLAGPLGADWPGGGPEVIEAIGQKIAALGLTDQPSAASLRKAWDALQADADAFAAVQNATSREELDEALGITARRNAAALWGRTK
jgi:hypothetical protein